MDTFNVLRFSFMTANFRWEQGRDLRLNVATIRRLSNYADIVESWIGSLQGRFAMEKTWDGKARTLAHFETLYDTIQFDFDTNFKHRVSRIMARMALELGLPNWAQKYGYGLTDIEDEIAAYRAGNR